MTAPPTQPTPAPSSQPAAGGQPNPPMAWRAEADASPANPAAAHVASFAHPPPFAYPQHASAPGHRPASVRRTFQLGLVACALATLATGLIMALVSMNSVIEIWFEYQWVPVARLVMGIVLCGIAIWGLLLLTRVKAPPESQA